MKKYIVTVTYSHESFGGYSHNDGTQEFPVEARNSESAKRKATKLAEATGGGYESRVISVRLQ